MADADGNYSMYRGGLVARLEMLGNLEIDPGKSPRK